MNTAWTDPVYPLFHVKPWRHWLTRLILCDWLCCHVPGVPQCRRRSDHTVSQGPCRRCGGHHYWRKGRWVMQYE